MSSTAMIAAMPIAPWDQLADLLSCGAWAEPEAEEQQGLGVEAPVPDRTPCWQMPPRIAELPDEAGG